jgi:uncharacterized protein
MPIPPRVSVVALRTVDLARSTAFYTALGWELSAASTPAMSLFKTTGSLLLVCTDDLLASLGGDEVAAVLQGEPNGEAVLSIHVASDQEVAAAVQEAAKAGGVVVKPPSSTPLGGSYAFFADPDGTCGRSSATRCTGLGLTGGPRSRRPKGLVWRATGDRAAGGATSRGAGVGRAGRWRPSPVCRSRPARRPAASRPGGW